MKLWEGLSQYHLHLQLYELAQVRAPSCEDPDWTLEKTFGFGLPLSVSSFY